MAISQSKYIDITSKILKATVGQRDLSGLVFTSNSYASGVSSSDPLAVAWDAGEIISLGLLDVATFFGSNSDEYKFAAKYFSYLSPSGRTPTVLNFTKSTDADPLAAFNRAIGKSTNFGSYTFLKYTEPVSPTPTSTIDQVYAASAALNFTVLAVHAEAYTSAATHASNAAGFTSGRDGIHFVVGADDYAAAIPMAIMAAIDYSANSSAPCLMYKQLNGETPTVKNNTDYETLVAANVNFYGQVQVNGQMVSFYQRGVNLDGSDTGIYMNEIWMKSSIATDFFNLATGLEKIPANYVGEAMLESSVIMPTVNMAVKNGAILPGKTLTEIQKAYIYQVTGDIEASDKIASDGWWLDVDIQLMQNQTEYEAAYTLAYAKGDGVRFVKGVHNLI